MNIITKIFLENRKEGLPSDLIEREESIFDHFNLEPKKIVVITGFRRVGKSYLCYQSIRGLRKDEIAYINFEDERLEGIRDVTKALTSAVYELNPKYLFLDEIQKVDKWSLWLRRFYDMEKDRTQIIVTGSSSKLSSREIPTELRGRNLVLHLFPLCLSDFIRFRSERIDRKALAYSEKEKSKILTLTKEYVLYGAMPEIVKYPLRKKSETLREYLAVVMIRDIIERHKIRKVEAIKTLTRRILNSNRITYTKLFNSMKSIGHSIGKETLLSYVNMVKNAYLFFEIPKLEFSTKEEERTERKVVIVDNGFISFFSLKFREDFGRLMENAVGVNLLRQSENNPLMRIYYWKDEMQREVDFVVKEGLGIKQLIQVCYDAHDPEVKKRELRALIHASKKLKCKNLLVITWDYEAEELIEWFGMKGKVKFVPLWKWLLEG